jgi:hypothetical protein
MTLLLQCHPLIRTLRALRTVLRHHSCEIGLVLYHILLHVRLVLLRQVLLRL